MMNGGVLEFDGNGVCLDGLGSTKYIPVFQDAEIWIWNLAGLLETIFIVWGRFKKNILLFF